jgi:DNA-binding transcriptional ArsR family regulator
MSLAVAEQQLRALSHPLRLRILSRVTGRPMSSAELARELGLSHAAVSFHVRKLVAAGYLELAETRVVRGGKERRYRQRLAGRAEWQQEDPRLVIRAASEEIVRRAAESLAANWRLFSDAELWVDQAVWDDVVRRIASAITELDAAARPPGEPGSVHVSASAMLFAVGDEQNEAAR